MGRNPAETHACSERHLGSTARGEAWALARSSFRRKVSAQRGHSFHRRAVQRDSSVARECHRLFTYMHFLRDSESRNPNTIHHIASGSSSQSGAPSGPYSSSVFVHDVWFGRHWASLCGRCVSLCGRCGKCTFFFCVAWSSERDIKDSRCSTCCITFGTFGAMSMCNCLSQYHRWVFNGRCMFRGCGLGVVLSQYPRLTGIGTSLAARSTDSTGLLAAYRSNCRRVARSGCLRNTRNKFRAVGGFNTSLIVVTDR
mmetsp:Transcript_14831/g.31857  ORF Transcript_14831/g.31857 Transcript_14831/m.31857 type:complete len:255 (+) Transcript_14831:410-1174(+)